MCASVTNRLIARVYCNQLVNACLKRGPLTIVIILSVHLYSMNMCKDGINEVIAVNI